MKNKPLRTVLRITLWLALSVFLMLTIIIFLHWQTNIISKAIERQLNRSLEGQVHITYTDIKGLLFNHIRIEKPEIRVDDILYIKSEYVDLRYRLWPMFSNEFIISRVELDQLDVYYETGVDTPAAGGETSFNLDSTLAQLEKIAAVDTLLKSLPLIDVDELEVRAASLNMISRDTFSVRKLNLELSLRVRPELFEFRLIKSKAEIPAYDLNLRDFSFQLIGNSPQFTLNQFKLQTDSSEVLFSGDVVLTDSVQMLLSLDRFYLSLPEMNRIVKNENIRRGYISGRAGIYGTPRYFNTQWHLSGRMMEHRLDSLVLDADYEYGLVRVASLQMTSYQSRLEFEGVLDLRGEIKESDGAWGDLRFRQVDLGLFTDGDLVSRINGHLQFNISNLNLKYPTGTGQLVVYDTMVDSLNLDSLRFALNARRGNFDISEPSFIKFAEQARFELNGHMDRQQLVDLRLRARRVSLASLSTALSLGDSLDGRFDATLRATGYLFDPDISGRMWINALGMPDIALDSTALELDVHRVLSKREGFVRFTVDSGRVYDVPVTEVRAHAELDSNIINISQIGFRTDQNYLTSAMSITLKQDTTVIIADHFRLKYENYYLENNGEITILADTVQISLEQFRLKGPGDTDLEIAGFWDYSAEDLQVFVALQNVALQPFDQFLGEEHSIGGVLRGSLEIITPIHNPILEVDIQGENLSYNDVQFGNVVSIFELVDRQIVINELQIKEGDSYLDLTGDLALTLDFDNMGQLDFLEQTKAELKINWSNLNLGKFAPLMDMENQLRGTVSGYLETEGSVSSPFIRQSLRMKNFRYDDFAVDSLVMFGQYNSGYLIVDSLSAIFNETDLSMKGWQRYDLKLDAYDSTFTSKPFEFVLNSSDDQLNFIGLFNEQLESVSGPYEMELYLTGTPEKPAISQGFFRLDDGEILLSRVKDPIRSVSLNATIADSVLTINEFTGYSKKKKDFLDRLIGLFEKGIALIKGQSTREGYLTAQGTVGLKDLTRPRIDIEVDMQQLYINYFIENTTLVLNTDNLEINGRDTLYIAGDVVVPQGRLEVDISQMQKNIYLTAPATKPTPPYLAMNLNVLIPGNFVVSSSPLDLANNFKITMEGELDVIMEPGLEDTKITGHLNTVSGNFSSLNQNFEVASGSIVFTNPEEINPNIELVAEKRISKYIVELVIGGTLEKQTYNINVLDRDGSQVPMSMPEKLSLLTLGTDLSQVTSRSDSTLLSVGEDVATTSVLTAVERGAETFTGLDRVEINSDDKILDLQRMKLNNGLQDASISFGKYLTSDLYVEYRTSFGELGSGIPAPRLSWDAGNRIGLQYRVNREWSLDSFYEKTLRGSKIKIGLSWEYTF